MPDPIFVKWEMPDPIFCEKHFYHVCTCHLIRHFDVQNVRTLTKTICITSVSLTKKFGLSE